MFGKVLIANRGEIACRIQRTLRKLGVRSVAVFSDADRTAKHVLEADERVWIGPSAATQSYLNRDAILEAAERTGAEAIHPGYGFLSENPAFAEAVESRGMAFIGPTPDQMRRFGLKHTARAIAEAQGVPLSPGTGLLQSLSEAEDAAARIGYPVMLKSTAGGGGIGMQVVTRAADMPQRYETVQNLATKNFGEGGVFLEKFITRARHIEVQIFGDGAGRVVALGERDCSLQRRNQKVVEETPAPGLGAETRSALRAAAIKLGQSVQYRSAGTVEFVYDDDAGEFYFLEVNTRLQVEHGVTELVTGIDLVEWMVRLAAKEPLALADPEVRGHAIEVRIYAEDPARDFRPSAGLLTEVVLPTDTRVDSWIEAGTLVSPFYDPMLAKLLVHADSRDAAFVKLRRALDQVQIAGLETNVRYLAALAQDKVVLAGQMTTAYLRDFHFQSATIEVQSPGTLTSIQEYPGRVGYWDVGIPPSGPMDDLSFRLANRAVGNSPGTAALELTLSGPTLVFAVDATIALAGAALPATLDGQPVRYYEPVNVRAGQCLAIGKLEGPGCRAYLAVRNGFDVPVYLGSRATFALGGFGGHGGRALARGDVLRIAEPQSALAEPQVIANDARPSIQDDWELGVIYGPHGAPDFFTEHDIDTLFATTWDVHFNSARTGVRLVGPKPEWARKDGGEAGLHPSNLHDNAYAIGTIDFTGDMPIILGPDGPSLGGFVCPATVVAGELWKVGQLKPGARVRFTPISVKDAALKEAELNALGARPLPLKRAARGDAILRDLPAADQRPRVVYRPSGDKYLLVEYGPMALDLTLRFRVHVLMERIRAEQNAAILDLTPGIRSLQLHYDSRRLPLSTLLDWLSQLEAELPSIDDIEVPTRIVRLPLSWDDPATRLAIDRYVQGVRKDAPWAPSNIEFIRRINGLNEIQDVKDIVFNASYLVLGLGDVYLGAPVATPIDPRHRLVTTKYNPARTWTPENAVGIGGAYLCVYGMEGPGGYQFVGRTLQMYNRFKATEVFHPGSPWLLRFFDQIRFYPVSAEELLDLRERFPHGQVDLDIQEERFRLRDYQTFLEREHASIAAFKDRQQAAFDAERQRWLESDQAGAREPSLSAESAVSSVAEGWKVVESPVHGSVWQIRVAPGASVVQGQTVCVLESMKMEIVVEADISGTVASISVAEGATVAPGQALVVLRPAD